MKKNESISIYEVCFYAYNRTERKSAGRNLSYFDYDGRRDFIGDGVFAGIAVRLDFCNERLGFVPERGVRHKVRLTLVDTTARTEIDTREITVFIPRGNCLKFYYADYPLRKIPFRPDHNYKLVVHDLTDNVTMDEIPFHLFSTDRLGNPYNWYAICQGGIRPAWENQLYRQTNIRIGDDYYIRFNLEHRFGPKPPVILPELEMRLYYPQEGRVDVRLIEPVMVGFTANSYFVEQLFTVTEEQRGVLYAELRCMGRQIAGFAFYTGANPDRGTWFGRELDPLAQYSLHDARKRLRHYAELYSTDINQELSSLDDTDFDELLDHFIASQLEE